MRTMAGTRVPGTTAPGNLWIQILCRCSSCAFLCATIGCRLCTSADGVRMRRPIGVVNGALNGRSVEEDGTGGSAVLPRRGHRSLCTNGNIRETSIPKWSSSRRSAASNTVTSRMRRSSASTFSRSKECPPLLSGKGGKSLQGQIQGSRISSVQRPSSRTVRRASARSHRIGVAKTFRDQPQPNPLPSSESRQSKIGGSSRMLHNVRRRRQGRKTRNQTSRIGRMQPETIGTTGKDRAEMMSEAGDATIKPILSNMGGAGRIPAGGDGFVASTPCRGTGEKIGGKKSGQNHAAPLSL